MTEEYKSSEKIIWNYLKERDEVKDFGRELVNIGKAFYGTVASMYRIPTFVRKVKNEQTIWQRRYNKEFGFGKYDIWKVLLWGYLWMLIYSI